MKPLATLDPETAEKLMRYLHSKRIPCRPRPFTEESGLPVTELLVEDVHYDAACEAAETWHEQDAEEEARANQWLCPRCRAPRLKRINHESLEVLYQCADCGVQVAF